MHAKTYLKCSWSHVRGPREQPTDSTAFGGFLRGVTVRGEDGGGLPVDLSRLIRGVSNVRGPTHTSGKATVVFNEHLARRHVIVHWLSCVGTEGGIPVLGNNKAGWTFHLKTDSRLEFNIKYIILCIIYPISYGVLCFILLPFLQSQCVTAA